MAYTFGIKIGGMEIPPPSGYSFKEEDIISGSGRNAQGRAAWDVVRENVGTLNLTWENLDGERLKQVVAAIRNKKILQVTFFNSLIGTWETRAFSAGDKSSQLARYVSGTKYWASLTVPFEEV